MSQLVSFQQFSRLLKELQVMVYKQDFYSMFDLKWLEESGNYALLSRTFNCQYIAKFVVPGSGSVFFLNRHYFIHVKLFDLMDSCFLLVEPC